MRSAPNGWKLAGWIVGPTVLLAVALALTLGFEPDAVRIQLRVVGRIDGLVFLTAFVAAPLHRLYPSQLSRWLLKNRKFIGIAFGIQQLTLQLPLAILFLNLVPEEAQPFFSAVLIPASAHLLIAAMLATSFPGPAAWLGKRGWKILHTFGMYVLFASFAGALAHRFISSGLPGYLPFLALFVAAAGLRCQDLLKRNPRRRSTAP